MTIAQWAVCGFLVFPGLNVFLKMIDKRYDVDLFLMIFGACITGCIGGALGWLWSL